jgi:hypothetical protein
MRVPCITVPAVTDVCWPEHQRLSRCAERADHEADRQDGEQGLGVCVAVERCERAGQGNAEQREQDPAGRGHPQGGVAVDLGERGTLNQRRPSARSEKTRTRFEKTSARHGEPYSSGVGRRATAIAVTTRVSYSPICDPTTQSRPPSTRSRRSGTARPDEADVSVPGVKAARAGWAWTLG